MILTIHRSERLIYTLRRIPDRIMGRWETWSFEPNAYQHEQCGCFMDIWTGPRPLDVIAPFGSAIIDVVPAIDQPEYRRRPRVHWDDTGIMAEQVYRLPRCNQRGFRLPALAAAPDAANIRSGDGRYPPGEREESKPT